MGMFKKVADRFKPIRIIGHIDFDGGIGSRISKKGAAVDDDFCFINALACDFIKTDCR